MDVERVKMMVYARCDYNYVLVLCPTLVFKCPFGTWQLLHPHVCEKSFGSALLATFPGVDVWLRAPNKQWGS